MEFKLYTRRPQGLLSYLLLVLLFGLSATSLSAQDEFTIDDNDQISVCSGLFVDSGGTDGDHEANGPQQITICSNSTASDQTHVRLTFTEFTINGTMAFYNGQTTSAEDLFLTLDDQSNNQLPVVEASVMNSSGCLTVVYNPAATAPGWAALISCERACQPVRATLASSTPIVSPADTGYIDVCIGEEITLTGMGIYTESGFIYDQSDDVSTFEWNFDDGTSATGTTVTKAYDQAGGYTVQLRITDQNGCFNLNQINQRIRVAPRPSYLTQDGFSGPFCSSDTFSLTASTQFNPNSNSDIFVTTAQQSFSARQQLSDTTFLPDGNGEEYTTTLEFTNFQAGQVISSPDDLEAICMNMEHSYVGDLDIWIECPNGTIATLVSFAQGTNLGGQYLGEANDDGTNTPGIGFDYCFNNEAEFTWNQAVDEFDIAGAESIPAGDYAPVESLNSLIGCPLNGDWTLNVRDNLGVDNGYIFSWGLQFDDDLFPDLELFDVGFQTAAWNDTGDLLFYSADSIVATPDAAGTTDYSYSVTDEFGCTSDTTITVEVLPFTDPNCFSCPTTLVNTTQTINTIPGTMIQTDLASITQIDTSVLFRTVENNGFTQAEFNNFGRAYRSAINVSNISPEPIATADQIESICVNLNTQSVGGVRLFVVSPNDELFELSTGNGGDGNNFTNTCFTSDATVAIQDGEAPFTGNFLPEGNFSTLIGATTNGNWELIVWTISTDAQMGEFIDWSITFRNEIPYTYSWSPNDGNLSCLDCPNPIVTAGMENATYTVTVTNNYGCEEIGTVNVNTNVTVDLELTSTNLTCAGDSSGTAGVVASNGTEPYTYLWSNGDETADITNLDAGTYTVTVTDVNGNSQTGEVTITEPDALTATASSISNVSCNGDANGTAAITVEGGTGEITYAWSNNGEGPDQNNLGPGTYTVTATDANGCTFTQDYTITEPAALELDVDVTGIACGNDGSGAIDLTVTGGTEGYTYAWSNDAETEDLENIPAGEYTVTVTDLNGCTASISVLIIQPAALELTAQVVDAACNGDASGSIDLTVGGGIEPYTYAWSNEAETEDLENIQAGTYSVTVTDGNGCIDSLTATVDGAAALEIEILTRNLLCFDDSSGILAVTVTGGSGNYTYLWSDGSMEEDRDGLDAGTYVLTVTDANGCSETESETLTQPDQQELDFEVTDVACNGENSGAIDLTIVGGTPPTSVIWSNNAGTEDLENVSAGTYSVTVTDFGLCMTVGEATVNEPTAIQVSAVASDADCAGEESGSISVDVEGGVEPYTYLWSNGAMTQDLENIGAGDYTGTVTDANGCTVETPVINIGEPNGLSCSVEITAESFNGNDGALSATVTGGTGDYSYLWSNGAMTADVSDLAPGTYTLTVTDENGCTTECSATLLAYGIVGDKVFRDTDRDGIQDSNESGISGVSVTIRSTDGNTVETTATGAGGLYQFFVLPGDYTVTFGRPNNNDASPQNVGGDDAIDSDADPVTLQTEVFSVAALENNATIDAGFFDPCVPGLLDPGTIAESQVLCGPGNQPELLTEESAVIVGEAEGVVNYVWMMTTGDPDALPVNQWVPIANTNSTTYQPGVLFETTYYARCVRIDECPYLESNIVMIVIGDDASADILAPATVCEFDNVTFTADNLGSNADFSWNLTGPVNVVSENGNSITVNYGSFGTFSIGLSVTENGCTATNTQTIAVQRDCDSSEDLGGQNGGINTRTQPEDNVLFSRVYPNPATAGQAHAELVSGYQYDENVRLQIFDATGRQIADQRIDGGSRNVRLNALSNSASGLYLIRLTQGEASETHRLILR